MIYEVRRYFWDRFARRWVPSPSAFVNDLTWDQACGVAHFRELIAMGEWEQDVEYRVLVQPIQTVNNIATARAAA